MTKDEFIDKLVIISEKKEKILLEIKQLSIRQEKAISNKQPESLRNLVEKKQKRIEFINKLDDEFENYFEEFKDKYKFGNIQDVVKSNKTELKKLKDIITSIIAITKDIQATDSKNKKDANNLLKSFEMELKTANADKKINSAYNVYTTPSAYFIDKKK